MDITINHILLMSHYCKIISAMEKITTKWWKRSEVNNILSLINSVLVINLRGLMLNASSFLLGLRTNVAIKLVSIFFSKTLIMIFYSSIYFCSICKGNTDYDSDDKIHDPISMPKRTKEEMRWSSLVSYGFPFFVFLSWIFIWQ